MDYPTPQYFDEFEQYLRTQGRSEGTIKEYNYRLKSISGDVETFFANPNLPGRNLKVFAYRAYLNFLTIKMKELTREQLHDTLDSIKAIQTRGNNHSENKWSVPKAKWADHIHQVRSRVGKMGVWLGFHFGLRLSEILHLRIQDINFKDQLILIRAHKQGKRNHPWKPKYNRERQIPFTKDQEATLKRWINEIRPKDLPHDYLLWTSQGPRKKEIVITRTFQRWCEHADLHPHVLRYSFATHWYEATKDIKFVSDMLGHANVSTTSEYLQLGKKESINKARKYFTQT